MREINPVRTIVVDGERVRVKRCRDCGETKRVAEDETSEFSVNRRRGGRVAAWKPYCKPCYARRGRALHRERLRDPGERERYRKRLREWREAKLAEDPDYFRNYTREWREAKLAEDPDYFRDLWRMNYRIRLERAGREPKRQKRLEEPRELIPNAPVREAVVERLNGDADLGWDRLGAAVFPGTPSRSAGSRLRRALGESPAMNARAAKRANVAVYYYQGRVSYEIAARVVEILGLDPFRAGV